MNIDFTSMGIKVENKIYNNNSEIYKGVRLKDNIPVVIKTLKNPYPSPEEIVRFKQEYRTQKKLHIEGTLTPYSFKKIGTSSAIIMEYFDGDSLDNFYIKNSNNLITFLNISIQISMIIAEIHKNNIIHKDINPSNILWNKSTNRVKIIDFGIATNLSSQITSTPISNTIEGTMSYIPPEQTGRINRNVDFRSDIYSLGITFYEMLTGKLPFITENPMDLIHSHIAQEANPPILVNVTLPKSISNIIMKMISKEMDDRYTTVQSLLKDLVICQEQLEQNGEIKEFELGKFNKKEEFNIPKKLYGRDKEIRQLYESFTRVSSGNSELFLISGFSGIGKTSLVDTIYNTAFEKNGRFIRGKFQHIEDGIPYAAISDVFTDLVMQILNESDEKLISLKEKILTACDKNGQILVEMFPKIELIIGKQPKLEELHPTEELNRFNITLINFISIFAKKDHPLVIFIDDLQWSDFANLKIIEKIITSDILSNLLIIGSYRDNEIEDGHPLLDVIDKIQKQKIIHMIHLDNLEKYEINMMISETLLKDKEETSTLTEEIYKKTKGNPFFTNAILRDLYEKKIFLYDSENECWKWELSKIQDLEISENVIDFLLKMVKGLPEYILHSLTIAACIGNKFEESLLSHLMSISSDNISEMMKPAIHIELITKADDIFSFQHDKIQEAAYELLPEELKQVTHLKIGRTMIAKYSGEEKQINISTIVKHMNRGRNLISSKKEKVYLAKKNLIAGVKAGKSMAFETASYLFKTGIELLGEKTWTEEYDLSYNLYFEFIRSSYMTGNYIDADLNISIMNININIKNILDRVKLMSMKSLHYSAIGKLDEAIEAGLEGLAILGHNIPGSPGTLQIALEIVKVKLNLVNKKISSLVDNPRIQDERIKLIIKLSSEILAAAYLTGNEKLFTLIAINIVNLSIKYGNSPESAYSYITYGALLSGFLNDLKSGNEFGKLGMALNEKQNLVQMKTRIYHVYVVFIHHWSNKPNSMNAIQKNCTQSGNQSGDYLYLSTNIASSFTWDSSLTIDVILKEKYKLKPIIERCNYQNGLDEYNLMCGMFENLRNNSGNELSFSGLGFDEKLCVEEMKKRHFVTGIAMYQVWKIYLYNIYDNNEKALKYIDELEVNCQSIKGLPYFVKFTFSSFLVLTALYRSMDIKSQKKLYKSILKKLKIVKSWEKNFKNNFKHFREVMEAELYRINGKESKAAVLYDSAIKSASKYKFLGDEAQINELAGKFYISWGFPAAAAGYIQKSHYLYKRWGAIRKVLQLENIYSEYFMNTITETSFKVSRSSISAPLNLDLNSIIESSKAMNEEINLEILLEKIITIISKNAGAEKTYLVSKHGNDFVIEAECHKKNNIVQVMQRKPLYECNSISSSIIQYATRVNESIILENASESDEYKKNEYIQKNRVKSLLCIPLSQKGDVKKLLYMENNLSVGVFNPAKVELLNVLSENIVISLDNAQMHKDLEDYNHTLEQRVEERSKQLMEKNEELERTHKELKILATTDPLTKLFNRRSMIDKLEDEKNRFNRNGKIFAVAISDIDNFKNFNDKYGHDCGDFVLQEISQMIQSTTRELDIVSRWGGEEFLILLPGTDVNGAYIVIEKIREKICNATFNYNNTKLFLSMTFGIKQYSLEEPISSVIKLADEALYRGKEQGKNCTIVHN